MKCLLKIFVSGSIVVPVSVIELALSIKLLLHLNTFCVGVHFTGTLVCLHNRSFNVNCSYKFSKWPAFNKTL
jgi:hypothetical protein